MQKGLPSTVLVGYTTYRVLRPKRLVHGDTRCYGITDLEACTISVRADLSHEKALETLIHEVWHCAWEAVSADHVVGLLDCRDDKQRDYGEEYLACSVVPVYLAALRAANIQVHNAKGTRTPRHTPARPRQVRRKRGG